MMGKLMEGKYISFCNNGSCQSPLNMSLVCISFSQLGIQLVSQSIHFHDSCHSFQSFKECIVCLFIMSWCPSGLVNATKSSVIPPDVQREVEKFTSAVKTTFVSVLFESVLSLHHLQHSRTLFQVSCRRCAIHHGPPSTRLFMSTSSHHLGISIRNKVQYLEVYMP